MRVKSALTSIALVAGLSFSGPAFAAMINGVEIPEGEMAAVQQRCDELVTADNTESLTADSSTTADDNSASSADNNNDSSADDAVVETAPDVNEAVDATTKIDLETITLQACTDAGLVTK